MSQDEFKNVEGSWKSLKTTYYSSSSLELLLLSRGWFNAGDFMEPPVYHRGFPYNLRHERINNQITFARSDKVGIAAGMWFGDPDIDAMERITNRPIVRQFSEILHKGIALENTHYSPVDSQNTAYVRELAPLMMVLVGVGRYDDIWA